MTAPAPQQTRKVIRVAQRAGGYKRTHCTLTRDEYLAQLAKRQAKAER